MCGVFAYPKGKKQTTYTIPNGVTNLCDGAFSQCTLTDIIIPSSVITIGKYAFCSSAISAIIIPENVTSIGDEAFTWCSKLATINIPDSVVSIGKAPFANCHNLKTVYFNSGEQKKKFGERIHCVGVYNVNEVVADNKKTNNEFSGTTLKKDGITYICNLNDFEISNKELKKYIGSDSFILIPPNVTAIGNSAFAECRSVKGIFVPEGVTSIGDYAFQISGLENIILPNSLTHIGSYAFSFCNIKSLPDNLKTISHGMFQYCKKLKKFALPNNFKGIPNNAFEGCIKFKDIIIPNGVTTIMPHAFRDCKNLESVTIPNSITTMFFGVFDNCPKLEFAYFYSEKQKNDLANRFAPNVKLIVKAE